MPIYEYQCNNCDHRLECIQKISDDPLLTCPKCDMDSLRKLVSKTSFRLKGTGWYATDFRDKGKKSVADKDAQATAGDAKPAEKSEAKPADSSSTDKPDKKEANSSA